MHRFANPARFMRIAEKLLPWFTGLTLVLLAFGLVQGLVISPPDYQQGDTVRIMYVHVPSAWMSMMIYSVMALASATWLIWKHPLATLIARESALIGAGFTLLTLFTGSLWGKPMWGTYWEWDARLTSVLVLFFFYVGYIALSDAYSQGERGHKICAILALVGFANIPVIRFSVDWWRTLHQPASVIRGEGIAIDGSMLIPLFSMAAAFMCFYAMVLILRVKRALIVKKIVKLQNHM